MRLLLLAKAKSCCFQKLFSCWLWGWPDDTWTLLVRLPVPYFTLRKPGEGSIGSGHVEPWVCSFRNSGHISALKQTHVLTSSNIFVQTKCSHARVWTQSGGTSQSNTQSIHCVIIMPVGTGQWATLSLFISVDRDTWVGQDEWLLCSGVGRDACPQEECALRHSFFFFLIDLEVLYNFVLVSVVQWNESAVCICIKKLKTCSLELTTKFTKGNSL